MSNFKKLLITISIFICFSLKAFAVDEIVITFNNTQLCAGSNYNVTFTSTLPVNTG